MAFFLSQFATGLQTRLEKNSYSEELREEAQIQFDDASAIQRQLFKSASEKPCIQGVLSINIKSVILFQIDGTEKAYFSRFR
jgi:hypothetical protein